MAGTRASYTLSSHSVALDRRVNAVRADLADVALADKIFAPHYAEGRAVTIAPPFTAMRDRPGGMQTSELLAGETFMLLDTSGGWSWGYSAHDHYVGYVESSALSLDVARDERKPPPNSAHIEPSRDTSSDPAAAALAFLDMPYLLGGRGGAGIDCSGLVQRAFAAAGQSLPRDSDMQQALGADVGKLERNDLVGFEGHIGIMEDGETLIHATAHHGKVVREPLSDVAARTAIVSRKRL